MYMILLMENSHLKKYKIMEDKIYCPWAHAYELCKDNYTQEEIDEMLMCEITELITNYEE